MDIQLPGMSGIEALGHLRADPTTPRHSHRRGHRLGDDGDRQRILAAGFDGYQSKPIDVKGFVQAVAEVLAIPAS